MRFDAALSAFAEALADPAAPPPAFTHGRAGRPDAKRFSVYRNNVAVGLIGALEARFPVCRRLVGDDFFRAMARAFVRERKPASPVLLHYGVEFPDFVAGFEPARELPYLADVARLESAWVESYHALDAAPLTLAELAATPAEQLPHLKFAFHPAARALAFAHPAASIWAAHQGDGEPQAPETWAPEAALVARPEVDVCVRILPPGGFAFACALRDGANLGQAAEALAAEGLDPIPHLVGLVEAGALVPLS